MRHAVVVLALLSIPFAARAQEGVVSPGMNRAQVMVALGAPVTVREASEFTYLFYPNGCGKACGMNDLVVLRRDSVVDAIFRSPSRHYTGTSSSPSPLAHADARVRTRPSRPMAVPASSPAVAAAPASKPTPATTSTPAAATRPAPIEPREARLASPADLVRLRRELLGSGLTTTQVRARLRDQGYPSNLLDADMRGAMPAPAPAAPKKMTPGAPNDTRPSIPAGEPPVRKAPASPAPAAAPTPTRPPAP